jgi:group I intron endonuclease
MEGIIYRAVGPTGLIYIGQTIQTLNKRKSAHKVRAIKRDHRTSFQIAILKYGVRAFQWEQIDTFNSEEKLEQKEKYWVAYYKSDDPAYGYNGTGGGIHYTPSKETLHKMSEARKGEKNPMYGRHLIPWNKGKTGLYSEEYRRKISEANKGQIPWNKGKKGVYTEETRHRISATLKSKKTRSTIPEAI